MKEDGERPARRRSQNCGNGVRSQKLLVLCPYPIGVAAGQRLKFEQYYDDWRAAGWDIEVSPYMGMRLWRVAYENGHVLAKMAGVTRGLLKRMADLFRLGRFDLVYCFMYVTPLGTTLFERLTRLLSKNMVYDIEDNLLVGQTLKGEFPNPLLRLLKGSGKAKYLVRRADHVIASSPFLRDTCLRINDKHACTYISSSVDTDRFVPANRYTNDLVVTVGWTGTFSSRVYLDLLRPVLQELARRRTFRLRVIGNFDYVLEGVDLEVIQWTVEREVEDLQGIDIGVYPLALEEWVSGKSGLKAIQYMAFGIPCVATDVGTVPMIIRDGDNGLLARTEEEWLSALERLIDDPRLRRRLGERARKDAVERYSTRAVAADYRRVLDLVMGDTSAE